MAKGLVKTKTKIDAFKASLATTAVALPAIVMLAVSGASALPGDYSLFDSATTVSGGNPGTAVQMVSDSTHTDGGVDYTVPSGMTLNQLTNLGTDYKITAGDCAGGSPRFQLNIGGKNVFVYIGPSPSYTGCTVGSWVSTGNLTLSADTRFDTSQYAGGNFYSTFAQAQALLGDQVVTGVQLVTDAGWAVSGGNQTVLADNTQINDTTYTYEPVVSTPTKDSCKNNGWKAMTNPGPFKNQGDCVSYFATGGRNMPSAAKH
ncbi:MAG TPA: hypothetical protein VN031_03865 [Candidatus Microsaccharimonas sp.]|nr:hypothetical protein [Candidatus Microsaccharimonas sp.]